MYCSRCKQYKPAYEFYESQPQVHIGWCCTCWSKASREARLRNPLKYALADTRRWARQRGLAYNLTIEHLEEVWVSQNGCCVVTQAPFSEIAMSRPPSIHRIDSTQGYLCGNVELILPPLRGQRKAGTGNVENLIGNSATPT